MCPEVMLKSGKTSPANRDIFMLAWIVCCFLNPSQVLAESSMQVPSIDILYGAYEIVGRLPGELGRASCRERV